MNNNNYLEQKKNTHLYFQVGDSQYAINTDNILEIMKLPALDYPQQLPNNILGLIKYNNFVINVIDIRFYLNIEVKPYNINSELIIVKTDEIIFGIVSDKVIGILPFDIQNIDSIPFIDSKMIIDSLYKFNNETIFIVNLYLIENLLKQHNIYTSVNVQELFPQDEKSKEIMRNRTQLIASKSNLKLATNSLQVKNKYISFSLNNDLYCISLDYVKEVLKDTAITKIPQIPNCIEGIMNLRGDYITVINLKKFLGFEDIVKPDKNPVIIVKCNELEIALLIDKINELFDLQDNDLINLGEGYFEKEFVLNNSLYTVLNIEKIVSDKKIIITDM